MMEREPTPKPGPFGIAEGKHECLLTWLAEGVAKRLVDQYSMPITDEDDVRQDIFLHVLKNWQYWKPGDCRPDAAIRVMVRQAATRIVKKRKQDILSDCESIEEMIASENEEQTWHPCV